MDQFCANANDTYRRCVCSSKLTEIQSRERALGQTSEQIINFKNLNLDIINKTASEVTAMLSATAGEYAQANSNDKSDSAKQLAGISEVLSNTKSKSLSTQGTLDIAGDINSIWATSDLAGSANIANLTGEALYNAVHAQCSELVANKCSSDAIQTMVTTAYGMYIENDCSAIINTLDKQKQSASGTIRQTEREMQLARLENYQSHNSTSINECIAQVRADITADTACGPDYIHCLDVTGLYLNRETGEPIYTQNFYQLETMTSLAGDVLTNQPNRLLVAELNRKREFASRGLDTCRDISDAVWDEFLRQAISEIYQGQQKRVRQVKNECIEIVNKCYDEKNQSLKDFSNIKEQLLLGQRMELSEQLCQEKMDACSNLYGGGPNGLSELLVAMHNITNQSISNQCLATLREYTKEYCAVPGNDTLHLYPYACRVYNPGDARYASVQECNSQIDQKEQEDNDANTEQTTENRYYRCEKKYRKCKGRYYLNKNNKCYSCPLGYESICNSNTTGVTYADIYNNTSGVDCGTYVGSLYHKLARYATQACVRPSESNKTLPATVLQDINVIMDEIRRNMAQELARECERLGGEWVDSIWIDTNVDNLHDSYKNYKHKKFYDSTSSNTDWGYCSTNDPDLAISNTENITPDETPDTPSDPTQYTLTLKNNNYWDQPLSTGQTIKHGCKIATPAETKLTITKGTTPPALTDAQIPTCQVPNGDGQTCTFKAYTSEDCMGNT
ncbi:MAG: hypothetical protein II208_03720, partial [Alphaproteobacteria bacterium]|nr:hypothetical protein [Alphaproteobacteria bacterium]